MKKLPFVLIALSLIATSANAEEKKTRKTISL